ncbi:hypothetical protein QWZ14_14590 [Paeniroseomonas aquatica]|uniref:Winged helix DNA-binding domain-containing protein n=1 Tax=Paeniroseomonas aquatica TaxID=373043 RepID=A0ABT8A7G1_9PROT|nr:hypothetical protein [Paeniroseomonas aquatica]MDN3565593.1 hypothetical protein [Paeniroseomonas aquatica]
MTETPSPIRVNRAPVLTLWAAVVARRLGHPAATAWSLAGVVAGTAARAKARRLGLAGEAEGGRDRPAAAAGDTLRLLGRRIVLTRDADGVVLAESDGRPAPAAPVAAYVARAFGPRLAEVRAAMEALAGGMAPAELERVGFRLYEHFRPEVPADVRGWGAKGVLDPARIAAAAGQPG